MIFNKLNYLNTRWKIGSKVKYTYKYSGPFLHGRILKIKSSDLYSIQVEWNYMIKSINESWHPTSDLEVI